MRSIPVSTSSGGYTVALGEGLLEQLPRRLAGLGFPASGRRRIFVLTSPPIWGLWGRRFTSAFGGHPPTVLFLPAGERAKRLAQIERLAAELSRAGADRSSLLLAFGGGVVGDAAGFLAAIYMRGIPFVQIPTTFLAQVDSSVGGKTGVNLTTGKNLIGSFHQPLAVLAATELLSTLPRRELHAGLYESVKAGLIRDAALFRLIEANREAAARGDAGVLGKIVAASVRVKADVVGQDEKESGLRMILNFGHTLGHAIEAAAGYGKLLHGEAIAWGMLAALFLSRERGWLSAHDAERAASLILAFRPPPPPRMSPERLLSLMAGDKKNRAGVRRFVLLRKIGQAEVTEDVAEAEVRAAIAGVLPQASAGQRSLRRG